MHSVSHFRYVPQDICGSIRSWRHVDQPTTLPQDILAQHLLEQTGTFQCWRQNVGNVLFRSGRGTKNEGSSVIQSGGSYREMKREGERETGSLCNSTNIL